MAPATTTPDSLSALTTKALARLQGSLDEKNPYEGHEMLKTSYYRARSKSKFADSYDMCAYGAVKHFAEGDYQCGVELGTMLLDSYKTDGVGFGEESCARVMVVINSYTRLREKDVERGRTSLSSSKKESNSDSVSTTETLIGGMQQLKHRTMVWLKEAAGAAGVGGENAASGADNANGTAEKINAFRNKMYFIAGTYTTVLTSWKGLGMALPDLIRSQSEDAVWNVVMADINQMRGTNAYYNDCDLLVARTMLHILECLPLECMKEAFHMAKGIFGRYLAVCNEPIKEASTSQCAYLLVIAMVRRNEKLVKVGIKALEESEGGVRDATLVELCKGTLTSKYVPSRSGGDMLSGLLSGLLR